LFRSHRRDDAELSIRRTGLLRHADRSAGQQHPCLRRRAVRAPGPLSAQAGSGYVGLGALPHRAARRSSVRYAEVEGTVFWRWRATVPAAFARSVLTGPVNCAPSCSVRRVTTTPALTTADEVSSSRSATM